MERIELSFISAIECHVTAGERQGMYVWLGLSVSKPHLHCVKRPLPEHPCAPLSRGLQDGLKSEKSACAGMCMEVHWLSVSVADADTRPSEDANRRGGLQPCRASSEVHTPPERQISRLGGELLVPQYFLIVRISIWFLMALVPLPCGAAQS